MIGSCTGLNFSFRLLLYDRADDGDLIVYPFLYRPLLVAIDIAHRDNTGRGTARSCFVRPTIVDESLNRWCRFHPVCGCLYVYKRQTRIHRIAPIEKGGGEKFTPLSAIFEVLFRKETRRIQVVSPLPASFESGRRRRRGGGWESLIYIERETGAAQGWRSILALCQPRNSPSGWKRRRKKEKRMNEREGEEEEEGDPFSLPTVTRCIMVSCFYIITRRAAIDCLLRPPTSFLLRFLRDVFRRRNP